MEKKNPYKFTLGFDKTKPTHARAVEILTIIKECCDYQVGNKKGNLYKKTRLVSMRTFIIKR